MKAKKFTVPEVIRTVSKCVVALKATGTQLFFQELQNFLVVLDVRQLGRIVQLTVDVETPISVQYTVQPTAVILIDNLTDLCFRSRGRTIRGDRSRFLLHCFQT